MNRQILDISLVYISVQKQPNFLHFKAKKHMITIKVLKLSKHYVSTNYGLSDFCSKSVSRFISQYFCNIKMFFFFTDRLILSQKRKLEKIEDKWMHSRQILTSFNGKTQKRRPSIFKHTVYQ